MPARRAGRCTVCGAPLQGLAGRYWITHHPDGVHESCRPWEQEPFPFGSDLERLRQIARTLLRASREIVRDGKWLRMVERQWPAHGERRAREWLERKRRLRHHLAQLRERLGL